MSDASRRDDAIVDVNPSDLSDVVGEFVAMDREDAAEAVGAAAAAQPAWRSVGALRRADVLDAAAREILARAEELGDLLAREEGKTLPEAVAEAGRAGQILRFHAGEALRNEGVVIESIRPGVEVSVTREPVGVVAVITPWNFPLAIPAWKIAPALAFGNSVVFKPADPVPACATAFVDILHRAGVPRDALQLVVGRGSVVGDVLTGAAEVDAVSFTGSSSVGERVLKSAQTNRARVQLEMGGKNPLVVADDADLDLAVEIALQGAFGSTGQRCTASSRLVVMDAVHDRFVDALWARLSSWSVGDAREPGIDMGPVVSEQQLVDDERYLETARAEGGQVLGGTRVSARSAGHFLSPALVLDTAPQHTINREEVFGPVASIVRVGTYDEAMAVANDTEFGLTAGIVTRSLARAYDFRRRSTAGMVMVNVPTAGVDFHVPFGGRGASSYGPREQGTAAREFFTVSQTAYVAAGDAD
jgi:acyl-CoA reductase-like NAD-dependent aldehyde dehydrogenase